MIVLENAASRLRILQRNFFIDEVADIKTIILDTPELVYDLSVNPTQNFIGGFGG